MRGFQQDFSPQRMAWFINLRWAAMVGGAFVLWLAPSLLPLEVSYSKLAVCLLGLGILNGLYLLYWENLKKRGLAETDLTAITRKLLHLQMTVDLCVLTAMLLFSGGTANPLFFLYLIHLAIGSILFPPKESLFYTALVLLLPWGLYFFKRSYGVPPSPWIGEGELLASHQLSILGAFSLVSLSLWYFLSRISNDLASKRNEIWEAGQKLKEVNEALRQMDDFKNQFLKQIVFQLKSPSIEMDFDLTAIENALAPDNEKARGAVQAAKKRVWILLELIEDLTWLSRSEAGEAPLQKESLNVYETLLKRIQLMEPTAKQKGITFNLHGDAQTRLTADPVAFGKLTDNLLSNAVKYTPEGESFITVEFKQEGDWLVLTFQDEGIGIPLKQQKKLFQQFFRATNAKTMEKFGTGLGLSIVKQVMDSHGGKIQLSSGPKKGTRVETWWPTLSEASK